MLKKVAIDKMEIDKLIKLKKYKEAFDYIAHVRKVIELVAKNRVNKFIESNIILEEERELFVSLIQNNINNKLLEDSHYMLVDEKYISLMKEKMIRLQVYKDKRRIVRKKKVSC